MLDGESVKVDVLAILWDDPRHGDEVVRALEERHGFRHPPTAIASVLQVLESGGFARGRDVAGNRVYTITDRGSEMLAQLVV